jgi:hypothetical protein
MSLQINVVKNEKIKHPSVGGLLKVDLKGILNKEA